MHTASQHGLWPRQEANRTHPVLLVMVLAAVFCSSATARAQESLRPIVVQTEIDGAITPVTARFVKRAIREAEDQRAQCLIIVLDTPGGLVDSTRSIVKDILRSRTCVVVYVAPSSAEAASAGGFITLSSHIAVMAPATTIGAMHPVSIGGLPTGVPGQTPGGEENGEKKAPTDSVMTEKIENNTAAWARGLAELRGRNADWAEKAVRESVAITDSEALEKGIIDLVAKDVEELLQAIDGREVSLPQGPVILHTTDVEIRTIEMWWGERVLATVSNPNVAFLLLVFGFYGVLLEFYSPGWGVAGTLGVICLVLAFFGLAVLPINYVGLLLIAVALGMFAAEVFVTSYGALAVGGIVCLVMGAMMLVESPEGFARVSLSVVIPVAAATAVIVIFLVGAIVNAHRQKVRTGTEGLLGETAVAVAPFESDQDRFCGTVRVHGEFWKAVSTTTVSCEQPAIVRDRDGLTLVVEPLGQNSGEPTTSDIQE